MGLQKQILLIKALNLKFDKVNLFIKYEYVQKWLKIFEIYATIKIKSIILKSPSNENWATCKLPITNGDIKFQ